MAPRTSIYRWTPCLRRGSSAATFMRIGHPAKRTIGPAWPLALRALRQGDVLVVWRLDRLGRNLKHLIETVDDLGKRGIGFQCLTGLAVDTTTPTGRFMLQVFGGLAEFERELIRERVMAGLECGPRQGPERRSAACLHAGEIEDRPSGYEPPGHIRGRALQRDRRQHLDTLFLHCAARRVDGAGQGAAGMKTCTIAGCGRPLKLPRSATSTLCGFADTATCIASCKFATAVGRTRCI